jgi:hypothetical protein
MPLRRIGEEGVQLHEFLTSALDGGERSASGPGRFTPEMEAPGTYWIGGWVGPTAGLDAVVKRKKFHNFLCRELNPGRPARLITSVWKQKHFQISR